MFYVTVHKKLDCNANDVLKAHDFSKINVDCDACNVHFTWNMRKLLNVVALYAMMFLSLTKRNRTMFIILFIALEKNPALYFFFFISN